MYPERLLKSLRTEKQNCMKRKSFKMAKYFVIVSGSSYGHPQSVEHPRSRSAQKNPSAGSGSCVFKKCGGGKLYVLLIHYTIFFLLKNVTF